MTAPALTQYAQGRNQVSADQLNTFEQTCNTYADLRTFVGAIGQQVFVRGGLTINDGLAGPFYWAATATAADDGGFIIAPAGAAIGRWLRVDQSQVTAGVTYLPLYGAKFDGVTDDTAAWQRAIVAANALTYATIVMPQGRSVVSGVLTPPTVPCTIKGQGMESSIIDWANTANLFFRDGGATPQQAAIGFEDFQIEGKWSTYQSDIPLIFPLLIRGTTDLRVERVKIYNVTNFGITARVCNRVFVTGCQIEQCGRDGINIGVCNFVQITDNRIDHCDDDCIAQGTQVDGPEFVATDVVIANNRITDSQGIKCLGARRMTIAGNQLDRVRAQGITAGVDTLDAITTPFAITIVNNVITDVFNRSTIDGLNSGNAYISLICNNNAGSGVAIPGHFQTTTGTLEPLYSNLPNDTIGAPLAPSHFINISGNILARTLETGILYSSYGYGDMFTRYGYLDFTVTSTMLTTTSVGVEITNGARYCNIIDNIINGLKQGISFSATASTDFEQINVRRNVVSDFSSFGVSFNAGITGGTAICIDDNTFDGDPYHTNANRGANGTWLANGSPVAILIQAASGLYVRRNIVKRVCRATDIAPTTNQAVFLGNFIEGTPVTVGFSVSNVGVGDCPFSGPGWLYRVVNNNNASALYQQTTNVCLTESSSIPTTGTYVRGHFVANNTPTIAAKIMGWLRITTGSSHVLGTDWLAVTSV